MFYLIFIFALLLILLLFAWVFSKLKQEVHINASSPDASWQFSPRLRRVIAGLQIVGSSVMALKLVIELFNSPHLHNLTGVCLYALPSIFAIWAALCGVRLWQCQNSSLLPSAVIWAMQVPHFVTSQLSYLLVFGFAIQLQIVSNSIATEFNISFPLIERHLLQIAVAQPVSIAGLNILAAFFAYVLLKVSATQAKLKR